MRAKYVKADIVHNVVKIEITNKKGMFSESYDDDEQQWSHNKWHISSWDDVCGENERLSCTILSTDDLCYTAYFVGHYDNYYLCGNDRPSVDKFLVDWKNDIIVTGEVKSQDAIWTGEDS